MFGKIFKINIVTIIIGLLLSTLLQYTFVIRHTNEAERADLRRNAYEIQRIVTTISYFDAGIQPQSPPIFRVRVRGEEADDFPLHNAWLPEITVFQRLEISGNNNFIEINPYLDRDVLLQTYLDAYTLSTGNYIIFVDTAGSVILSSYQLPGGRIPNRISENYYQDGFAGIPVIVSTDLGVFNTRMLTYRLPIVVQGEVIGAIFVCSPLLLGPGRRGILFNVFLLPMFLVTLVSLIFSYILSRKITKPIKAIGDAAKAFSKGEFKERVKVSGRDEISKLSETFNKMADDLEKIENLRRSFVANVSHELRTPMTTIIGFIDGILDGTIPEDTHKDYLSIVLSESKRLSRLVSDLLDIVRMEEDEFKLDVSEFDINEMIRRLIIGFERRIEEKNISVNVNFSSHVCEVFADSDGISRVLTNLIDNAIKFTNDNGSIDINIKLAKSDVVVTIRNSGDGILDIDRKHIFDRFYKADKSRGINRDGTGLGLYIVKNILYMHGRDIAMNSVAGEFTEFTFTLSIA